MATTNTPVRSQGLSSEFGSGRGRWDAKGAITRESIRVTQPAVDAVITLPTSQASGYTFTVQLKLGARTRAADGGLFLRGRRAALRRRGRRRQIRPAARPRAQRAQASRILRRVNQDAGELGDRLVEILGSTRATTAKPPTWKGVGGKLIELRGCEHEKDKQRYKGRARDFIGYDELADFLESQYVFINTWNRSVDPKPALPHRRARPTGRRRPRASGSSALGGLARSEASEPGQGRRAPLVPATDQGEIEVDGPGPHDVNGRPTRATSRTFIRSKLSDNPDLAPPTTAPSSTACRRSCARLPRRRLHGRHEGRRLAGHSDRLDRRGACSAGSHGPPRTAMTAMAVDVAPGGGDKRVIAWRYGGWFAPLDAEGIVDKTGRLTAGVRGQAPPRSLPGDRRSRRRLGRRCAHRLKDNGIDVIAFNGVVTSTARTRDGKLKFVNKRAEATWRLREELDPTQEGGSGDRAAATIPS
jgi:hypothetical protein